MMKKRGKRGQITIFIIVAMVVVLVAILIFMFRANISEALGIGESQSPSEYMRTCLSEKIDSVQENIARQGGNMEPEFYYQYQGDKLTYLCYQEEYYLPCIVQQPLLINHINEEIEREISSEVNVCLDSLKETYEKKGYVVQNQLGDINVELLPKRILVTVDSKLTLTKDTTNVYPPLRIDLNNNLYELASIAESIVQFESTYGDSEVTTYMDFYRDLKAEKLKQTDGTTVYILTNRDTGEVFQFASRGLAWPPGYGNIPK